MYRCIEYNGEVLKMNLGGITMPTEVTIEKPVHFELPLELDMISSDELKTKDIKSEAHYMFNQKSSADMFKWIEAAKRLDFKVTAELRPSNSPANEAVVHLVAYRENYGDFLK